MDAIFEFFAEVFFEIFAEVFGGIYIELMSLIGRDCKRINREKLRTFIIYELIVLFLMFIFGLFLSLSKEWTSIFWKTVFIIPIVVTAVQIGLGLILVLLKKIRKKKDN